MDNLTIAHNTLDIEKLPNFDIELAPDIDDLRPPKSYLNKQTKEVKDFNIYPLIELYGFKVITNVKERWGGNLTRIVQLTNNNIIVNITGNKVELKIARIINEKIETTTLNRWDAWEVEPNEIYRTIGEVCDKVNNKQS